MPGGRKKLYLGLMLAGAVALGVDRLVLSGASTGPSTALAQGQGDASPVDPASLVDVDAVALPIPELPFPRGLVPIAAAAPIRDCFLPPLLRRKFSSAADGSEMGAGPKKRRSRVGRAEFVTRHRLGGIVQHDATTIAIVDGAWLTIGQRVLFCMV